ncbi:tetratricopeptide repeat protein [Peristeroidobacter soli]|uniref:tetratricopeptide repeat protein n=1 Tax=Peristeroidobacter soli TaxID=2497877 RepID=UPI00130032A5|nr:tetratricopeptide repeat protein [Peristeroidobacter soli]
MLFVCSGAAYAYSDEAGRLFRAGSSAFQAGDYTQALAAFESALAQGMSGPALHFNIGVAAYRAGNYARAEAAFKEVANTPAMAALAYYNLGLVELKRNDPGAATRWFARVEAATQDPKLRQLAAARLGGFEAPQPSHTWFGYAGFGIGHDDNVALVSNSDVLGISDRADNFAEAQFALSMPFGEGWRIDGGVNAVDYQELDSFDQLGLQLGGRYRWHSGEWLNDAGTQVAHTMLDGSSFESRRALFIQTSRELRSDLTMRGRYRFNDIDGHDEFRGLSGRRHELSASLDWLQAAWDFRFGYLLEIGDYDDAALSATRHEVSFDAESEFATDWSILFEASRRLSSYDDNTSGNEQRTELALALTRTLTARWQVFLRYAYSNNDADTAEFDYTGNRLSAGVEATL